LAFNLAACRNGSKHYQTFLRPGHIKYEYPLPIFLISHLPTMCPSVTQIPSGRKSALDAYGEIIFRAWKDSVGSATQLEIENTCILVSADWASCSTPVPLLCGMRALA